MTDEGLCASGKMGLCIKCPDCMRTKTKFKVNDQARLVSCPDIKGPVQSVRFDLVTIEHEGDFLAYPSGYLEHVPEEKKETLGGLPVEVVDQPSPFAAQGYVFAPEDDDPHQDLVNHMANLLAEWGSTFDKKQRAYGPKAIANAPLGAAEGLLNRIHDKYSRLVQLMQNPDVDDLGEATADTVKDMGIYCAMLVLVNEGKWPGV